jgi:flagellar capping protein FliD
MERVDYSKLNYEIKVDGGNLAPEPKPIEDEKQKHIETLTERSQVMEDHARDLERQLAQSMKALEDYKNLTEERFNKLAKMISGK